LGRLLTDETLTSIDDPRIVAAGDAAAPSGEPLRMSCQAAMPLGVQAANTVLSRIAGTEPEVISLAFVGQCISLGRAGGVIQLAHTDDTALPLFVGGRTAAAITEAVCASTFGAGSCGLAPLRLWFRAAAAAARYGASTLSDRPRQPRFPFHWCGRCTLPTIAYDPRVATGPTTFQAAITCGGPGGSGDSADTKSAYLARSSPGSR
jgi:hypothetical protein